jgi:hypothetical protein
MTPSSVTWLTTMTVLVTAAPLRWLIRPPFRLTVVRRRTHRAPSTRGRRSMSLWFDAWSPQAGTA